MLCEKCRHNKATIHYTQIVNEKIFEYHLCEKCAKDENISSQLNDFDIFSMLSPKKQENKNLSCPYCETSLAQFKRSSMVGCSKCYEVFSPFIDPMLKQLHGTDMHPKKTYDSKKESQSKSILSLKSQLKKAVENEEYEKAASLRDEIKKLEGGENK